MVVQRLAVLVAGILTLGACGDGDDRLSKGEFLDQASTVICEGFAELQEASARVFSGAAAPSDEQIRDYVDVVADNVGAQLDAIDELDPPRELEEAVEDLVEDGRGVLERFVSQAKANPQNFDQIEQSVFGPYMEQGANLGLGECD